MNSPYRSIVIILAVSTFIALVLMLDAILVPFLVGLILGYLGDPLVDRLEKIKIPRTLGVFTVFLVFGSVFASALLIILPLVLAELSALIKSLPAVFTWFQTNYGPSFLEFFGLDPFEIKPEQVGIKVLENWAEAGGVLGNIVSSITDSAFTFFSATGNFFLSLIVAFYFMIDFDAIVEKIHSLIPRRYEATAAKLGIECDEILGAFLRGQMWVMFLMGCVYSLGLYVLGIDQALLIGFLAGLGSIIPYLGFALGFLGATIAALIQFGDLFFLVYVALVFLAAQLIETVLLTPWLVGDRIGLHPLAVIFSLMVGGYVFGFVGILLALPLSAVAMVLLRHWHQVYIESLPYLRKKEDED